MSETTAEPDYIRTVTRKQCLGCGATGESAVTIVHEDYCPEQPVRGVSN